MNHRGRWRIGALAGAIALLGSLASLEAHALALGRITVQSALGEPLRGEIDITDMSPEEASSLKVGMASAEVFRAAGLDYPSALAGLDIRLQRRSNGRPYLRLNSSRAVTEPFVDLILEANSSSGRITRDYTMLFDPPNLRASNAELAPMAPILPRPAAVAPALQETPDPLASSPLADAAQLPPEMTPARPAPGTQLPPEMTPAQPAPGMQLPPEMTPARPAPGTQLPPEMTPARPAYATQPPPEMASSRETPVPPATRPVPVARPIAPTPRITTAQEQPAPRNSRVVVKAGDTATKIATRTKPADVSLDQMLVALLRGNPDAFIGGNVNVMKSGAVLDIPQAEEASALPPAEASQIVVAQSRDFNAFRRKLAQRVSAAQVATANRRVEGNLQAQVKDQAQTSAPPNILTITQGAIKGKPPGAEDAIAKEKEAKDAATRMTEMSKNIAELKRIAAGPAAPAPAAGPASAPAPVPGPAITVATPPSPTPAAQPPAPAASTAAASASTAAGAADATLAATAPASDASSPEASLAAASEPVPVTSAEVAPQPAAIQQPVVTAPPPEPEPELMDLVMDNALPIGAGVGVLALLGGLGFLRYRQQKKKKKSAPLDSSFLESRLQPDSFFGASGGSRVNTNNSDGENSITGSSMAYTPSQMDASGDVDPVAEADVYLAYGRDEQAEDILKEALQTYPTRVAVHAKLLEIYAKRRDIKAFEKLASEAFKLTQGHGAEWALITEMGAELDPHNPLYRASEGAPEHHPSPAASASAPASAVAAAILPAAPVASAASAPMDMDMDFSLDDEPPVSAAPVPPPVPTPAPLAPIPVPPPAPILAKPVPSPASATPPVSTFDDLDLGLDFDIEPAAAPAAPTPPKPPAPPPVAAVQAPPPEIDMLSNSLDFTPMPVVAPKPAPAPAPAKAAPAHDDGMMEFDLDAFSLDLGSPAEAPAAVQIESQEEDPLEVKFMLAEEFRSLGDTDGARSLADEVMAKAKGPLKIKAQAFLNALA